MAIDHALANMQIMDIFVQDFNLKNKEFLIDTLKDKQKNLNVTYSVDNIYEEKGIGTVNLFINLSINDKEDKIIQLDLTSTALFRFSFSEDETNEVKREIMDEMLSQNGCAVLYSNTRAFISSVTSLMLLRGNHHITYVKCL